MIREVEGSYQGHLRSIAQDIVEHHGGAMVLMLSGPSSSGKTTTARLLRDYLTELGETGHIISLDDFYLGRGQAPKLPDGSYDYESVEALDVEAVKRCLLDITTTGEFSVPRYSFPLGRPDGEPKHYKIGRSDLVVVEGLHALNPVFTRELPEGSCVKLYVSVKQRIKGRQRRGHVPHGFAASAAHRAGREVPGHPAEGTLAMWGHGGGGGGPVHPALPAVCRLHGEFHPPLRALRAAHRGHSPAAGDRRGQPLLPQGPGAGGPLMRFEPLDPSLVPERSMLREFLGP